MKRFLCRVLYTVLCLWIFGFSMGMAQTREKSLSKANKAFFNDEPEKAIALYTQALEEKPDNLKINYRLGYLYLQLKEPAKAIPFLLKACKLTPKYNAEFTRNLADAYHLIGDFEEAMVQYKAAIANTSKKDEEEQARLDKLVKECVSGQQLKERPLKAEIHALPAPLNSAFADHGPFLFNNDQSLIFTSRRPLEAKRNPDENIFITNFDGRDWSLPKALGSPINTPDHDAVTGISTDGNTMYLYRFDNGGDIFQVKKNDGNWGKPEALPEPINSEFYEPSVFITADNQYAIFASDRYEGFGGLDLYICMRQPDGTWSEALNLGGNINTEYDEDAPFITADGLTLYFSSRGHNSMGGYDIFSSNTSGAAWSKAENLGFPVNSPYDDIYLVTNTSGQQGFFSSDRSGGVGEKDIYSVTFKSAKASDSILAVSEPLPIIAKDTLVAAVSMLETVILRGKVTEAGAGAPLAAQLVLTEENVSQPAIYANADPESGMYQFELAKGRKYSLTARKEGYFYASEIVMMPETFNSDTLARNIALKKINTGSKIVLQNLFFEYNSAKLSANSREELDRLYALMLENKGLKVEISGHTDSKGKPAYNQTLSLKRAQSVVDYLREKGIDKDRLQAVGYGAEKPISTNKTEAGRKQNRRTEFKVLHK